MIILDTNVVSEPLKKACDPKVLAWLDEQAVETLYLTAICLAELLAGIEIIDEGKRKRGMSSALRELLDSLFADRILPFDKTAAIEHALLAGRAKAAGQAISLADGQTAAIARVHSFSVATRDTSPFAAAGVRVINPWL